MNKFRQLVEQELVKIRQKTKPVNSWHEGYGVLLEEVDELWDEVKKKVSNRDKDNMIKELVQISAVCEKMYQDLI